MIKKFLSACVFANLFFSYSYSMDPLTIMKDLVDMQRYADLDAKIREYSGENGDPTIQDWIGECFMRTGDVCLAYHICKNNYLKACHSALTSDEYCGMQRNLIFLLVRVYIDVVTCISVGEKCRKNTGEDYKEQREFFESKGSPESIYNLFRDKARDVWGCKISNHISDFNELVSFALGDVLGLNRQAPSYLWVYYCSGAMLREWGWKPYTVWFGNVDARYNLLFKERYKKYIKNIRRDAFKRIGGKLDEISKAKDTELNAILADPKLSDEEKYKASLLANKRRWKAFLNFDFKDI